jgi:hypothetical protein
MRKDGFFFIFLRCFAGKQESGEQAVILIKQPAGGWLFFELNQRSPALGVL